jgi:hypothetical protein
MEQNLHSFNHQLQRVSNESNALSINSNSEIEEPKDDEFFDAAKKNVIKKLELEELKEELESAEYQEAYPEVFNIYEDRSDPISFDSSEFSSEMPHEIREKIKKKETEIVATEIEYTKQKNKNTDPKYSKIILYNDTLDGYIKNKEKLSSIIKDIDKEVKNGIEIRVKLENIKEIEKTLPNETLKEKKNRLETNWKPIFISYEVIRKKIRQIFNSVYENKLLDINDQFYIKLSELKPFNTYGLFYKAIYDSNDLNLLLDRLLNNVFEILKDYTRYNDHVESITTSNRYPGGTVHSKYKEEIDNLQAYNLRLNTELSQIKRNLALPHSGRRRQDFRRLKEKTPEQKKKLTEKMDARIKSLQERKDAEIRKLNEEIQELKSKQTTQDTNESKSTEESNESKSTEESKESKSTESHDIEELNRRTEELIEILDKKIADLSRLQKLVNSPEELDSELQILESQDTGFLSLVIDAADLYGKPEEKEKFKDSFNKLLDYHPDNKFMFADVFAKMEQGQGNEKLDNFLKNLDTIPDDLFKDLLILEITRKITIPT